VGSGVEEEFRIFFDKWKLTGRPRILCYIKTAPTRLQSLEQLEQARRVLEFKDHLRGSGIVYEFESLDELEHILRAHLTNIMAPPGGVA